MHLQEIASQAVMIILAFGFLGLAIRILIDLS